MKCCGKNMYDNEKNYHCNICGKRIPKICPVCGKKLYINENNVHCKKNHYRKFF